MHWEWVAKINNPVTLTAFALGLVFWAMSRVKAYRWWPVAAMCLATITVTGGLALAYIGQGALLAPSSVITTIGPGSPVLTNSSVGNVYVDVGQPISSQLPSSHPESHAERPSAVNTPGASMNIETHGAGSPAIVGSEVKGDIIIRSDQPAKQ